MLNTSLRRLVNKSRTILLIDDSDYIIEGTASLLRFEGYTVITASNGRDGLALAKQHHPDLIICDVSMPEMDGYTVLRHLRDDPDTASLRFMFLTARTEKSDMRMGMDIGADDYLIKPFSIEELLSAIDAQWKKHELLQRNVEEIKLNVTYALPHEFRTPLNQILAAAHAIRSAEPTHAAVIEYTDDIIASAQRLLRITENFLVYAQLEALSADRTARDQLCRFHTDEAAAVAADIAVTKAERYGRSADLVVGSIPEGVCVAISSENFHKLLDELLDNAFKFSQAGTPVQVEITTVDSWLEMRIRDAGPGMTAAQISKISAYTQFNRFVQEQQGIGLGLVIARRLVELHGGEFRIDSVPDRGTDVTIRLPRC